MCTEYTDRIDQTPVRGWVLFDAECAFCTACVARTRAAVEAGGFRYEPLQSPWVRERLNLPEDVLLAELRVLTVDGRVTGGADALVDLAGRLGARRPWWAWLLLIAAHLPFGKRTLRRAYRGVAARRSCRQGGCDLANRSIPKKEGIQ